MVGGEAERWEAGGLEICQGPQRGTERCDSGACMSSREVVMAGAAPWEVSL
jgi:hypothetical protein